MATKRNHPDELLIGLVSISDRASQGVYEDKGIPSLQEWLTSALSSPWRAETRLIQDEAATISATLIELVDETGCDLILTTGGTGPSRRDVTPEATLAVATKPMPGFGENEWDRCRHEFRVHCIERHGLDPNDTERECWFDLEALTLTLLDD